MCGIVSILNVKLEYDIQNMKIKFSYVFPDKIGKWLLFTVYVQIFIVSILYNSALLYIEKITKVFI